MAPKDLLRAIFEADLEARNAETALFAGADEKTLVALLSSAVDQALADPDRRSATVRLERLADLCAQVAGPKMADALVRILNDEDPGVRVLAGEALLDVGYERYAEIARAIERALDAPVHGPAMSELPYVLAEIGEPSALKLIKRFLAHPDAETVAAGIEALASLGEPGAATALEALVEDRRTVVIDDSEDEGAVTLGELAAQAIEELRAERRT